MFNVAFAQVRLLLPSLSSSALLLLFLLCASHLMPSFLRVPWLFSRADSPSPVADPLRSFDRHHQRAVCVVHRVSIISVVEFERSLVPIQTYAGPWAEASKPIHPLMREKMEKIEALSSARSTRAFGTTPSTWMARPS